MRFWNTLNLESTMNYAQQFIVEAYSLHLEKAQHVVNTADFDRLFGNQSAEIPSGLLAVQDFTPAPPPVEGTGNTGEAHWVSSRFWGRADQMFDMPPARLQGFVARNKSRDTDVVRYLVVINDRTLRLITYNLGEGFDAAIDAFEVQRAKFEAVKTLDVRFKQIAILFYVLFFLPVVLVIFTLAVSFTKTITKPIIDLTEATRKVASGDFSIHITAKRKDELGVLIQSFNTMVQDLEKTRKSLIKAETMSVWQRMAAHLAHDIKNLLTPIKLSAERALRHWRNNSENTGEILEASLFSIIQEAEGFSNMLDEYRILSHPMEPSVSNTAVSKVIAPLIASYRLSYPAVEFDAGNIDYTAVVKVDERRLTQIITNLVVNSIDAVNAVGADHAASGAGGVQKIEIRTDTVKKQGIVFCRISITDTGHGIPSDAAKKIFTPYFTTKEKGTGLGLSIVERIVDDHRGAIWFNSSVNAGTTFFVDLPTP
jgi:nitrogen fixation/metabolism regulation signal transduction histidine kinase